MPLRMAEKRGKMRMYRVYLVDDDELILDDMIAITPWMEAGFEVCGKNTNPLDALKEIPKLDPDAVFVDLKMPDLNGNELIFELKKAGCKAEFVMISAYDDFENVRSFFKQTGFDYVLKPVGTEDIRGILELLSMKLSKDRPSQPAGNPTDNPNFNELIEYVNENFTGKIQLGPLAARFGFSKGYVCALFQKYYNKSLSLYLTDLRMEYAKKLLEEKTLLVKQVGAMCGYADYYHFFKVFKNYYGVSPKEMRNSAE